MERKNGKEAKERWSGHYIAPGALNISQSSFSAVYQLRVTLFLRTDMNNLSSNFTWKEIQFITIKRYQEQDESQ